MIYKIVFFGDSLTCCPHVDENKRWSELCLNRLREDFSTGLQIQGANRGVSGETTTDALSRFEKDVLAAKPNVVVIQFGANDSVYWKSLNGKPRVEIADFAKNLLAFVTAIRRDGGEVILQTSHRFLRDHLELNSKTHNQNLETYNDVIRKLARDHHCNLVDVHGLLGEMNPSVYQLPLPDGLHLNEEGCLYYSQALLPTLKTMLSSFLKEQDV